MLIGTILLVLAGLNRLIGKSWMWPPCVFALTWAMQLLAIPLSDYLQLSFDVEFFFLLGAICFSAGGVFAMLWRPMPAKPTGESRRWLRLLLVAAVVLGAVFVRHMIQLARESHGDYSLIAARAALLEQQDSQFVDNAVPLAMIVAMIFALRDNGTRKSKILTVATAALALGLNIIEGMRGGAISLTLILVFIFWIKRRLSVKTLLVAGAIAVLLFAVVTLGLGKGDVDRTDSLMHNVPALWDGFLWYAIVGPIEFGHVFHSPTAIPAVWHPNRVFLQAANKLGARFEVPILHAEFLNVSELKTSNVYSMYFAYYPHFGYLITLAVMIALGFICAAVHRKALTGERWAVLVAATLFAGIVISPYSEQLAMNLNFIGKTLIVCWLVYGSESFLSRIGASDPTAG